MPAQNTVEATLRSRYDDGIAKGIEHTERMLRQGMASMGNATGSLAGGFNGAFDSMMGRMGGWREELTHAANTSDSQFKRIGLGAAVLAVAIVESFIRAGKAVGTFLFDLVKEASELTELKLSYEALTSAMNVNGDVLMGKLKRGTEGLISSTTLLRNVNRVLQSEIPITADKYAQLVGNVFGLAKAAGADTAQAVNTLTDALIRGNARGFQAIGIHINVKDAVSELATAMGIQAGRVADSSKLQAFYNDLLEKTTAAAAKLPPQFISVEDALQRVNNTWRGWLLQIGEAIGRSGVLQEMLRRMNERLFDFTNSKKDMESLTLSVNQFFIGTLRGIADMLDGVGTFTTAWNIVWGAVKVVVNAAGVVVAGALGLMMSAITWFVIGLSKLPGSIGKTFRGMAVELETNAALFTQAMKEFAGGVATSFAGTDETRQKLLGLASSMRTTAGDLESFSQKIISGSGAVGAHGNAAADAAEKQKGLNDQLKKYNELRMELAGRNATPERQALLQLMKDYEQIGQLTAIGEEKRNQLRLQAVLVYDAKIVEATEKRKTEEARLEEETNAAVSAALFAELKERSAATLAVIHWITGETAREADRVLAEVSAKAAKQREEERQKQVAQAIATAGTIERAIDLSRKGTIDASIGTEALARTPEVLELIRTKIAELNQMPLLTAAQIEDLEKLKTAQAQLSVIKMPAWQRALIPFHESLQRLNKIGMDPFHQTLNAMQEHVAEFGANAGQAFAAFFADVVSGQDASGKKLLAAFIGMIGQMLVKSGVMLIQVGLAEIVLSQTLMGRLMGASAAAGAKALAVGALLAAMGGVMQGAASSMAQTNQSGAGGSFQQDVPRPTSSSQVPIYMIGSPRGAQTPGQASAAPAGPQLIRVEIAPPKGWVANEVVREVKGNNQQLRVVIANA